MRLNWSHDASDLKLDGHFDNRTNMVTLLTLRAINIKYNFPIFIGMFCLFIRTLKRENVTQNHTHGGRDGDGMLPAWWAVGVQYVANNLRLLWRIHIKLHGLLKYMKYIIGMTVEWAWPKSRSLLLQIGLNNLNTLWHTNNKLNRYIAYVNT